MRTEGRQGLAALRRLRGRVAVRRGHRLAPVGSFFRRNAAAWRRRRSRIGEESLNNVDKCLHAVGADPALQVLEHQVLGLPVLVAGRCNAEEAL